MCDDGVRKRQWKITTSSMIKGTTAVFQRMRDVSQRLARICAEMGGKGSGIGVQCGFGMT